MKAIKKISGEAFDRLFDEGSDKIDSYIDWSKAKRPGWETKRVNMDIPQWILDRAERQASRQGTPRMSILKAALASAAERDFKAG
jgi:hypothetical protein